MIATVVWGTGNIGRLAIRAVHAHPQLDLAAVVVHNPAKVGRDAAGTITTSILDIYRTYLGELTPEEQETLLALYRKIARVGQPRKVRS